MTAKQGEKAPRFAGLSPLGPPLVYGLACVYYSRCTGDVLGDGLAWNMGLAVLPSACSAAARRCRSRLGRWAVGLLWLIFLPNTFYMMTDLIHVPQQMEWVERLADGTAAVRHSFLLREWALLLLLGVGAFLAALLGCREFLSFARALPGPLGKAGARLCTAALSLLCAVGIYIGRFLRFNSWDILAPARLLQTLCKSIDGFSIQFMFLTAGGIVLMVWFCRCLLGPQSPPPDGGAQKGETTENGGR